MAEDHQRPLMESLGVCFIYIFFIITIFFFFSFFFFFFLGGGGGADLIKGNVTVNKNT